MGVNPSEDPLAGVAMFAGLDPQARRKIADVAVPRHYRRGRLLFFEGEAGESLIMIRSGAVSVFRTAATGERAMLHVARAPEVLGEVSLLDGSPRSASAEALEDTTALALARSSFLELVHGSPKMLDAVLRSMGMIVRRLTEQSSDHVFLDLPGRVAKTLVRLAEQHSSPMTTIELNQTQLAEMAGGSRQSVNQAIGIFANRGWLRTEGRKIVVVDLPALRRRAGFGGAEQ
ncbi:Crp/Fnr family transcriptional regulator [Glycomyces halotolerans]